MVKLTDVTGIGPVTVKLLSEHNIKTVEALAAISLTELLKVSGFSDIRARAVKKAASDCLRNKAIKPSTSVASSVPAPVKKAVSIPVPVKKTVTKKIAANPIVSQVEAD